MWAVFLFLKCTYVFRVAVRGYQENLDAINLYTASVAPLERFGVEFVLTFIVVLTYFVSVGTYKKWTASATFAVGASYTACTFVSVSVISFTR